MPCTVAHCDVPHPKCLTTSLPDMVTPGTKDESPSATRSDFMITWQAGVCVCVCVCVWQRERETESESVSVCASESMRERCASQKALVKGKSARLKCRTLAYTYVLEHNYVKVCCICSRGNSDDFHRWKHVRNDAFAHQRQKTGVSGETKGQGKIPAQVFPSLLVYHWKCKIISVMEK